MPNKEWETPDDGQRNCPKNVEFLEGMNLGNYYVCLFYYKETDRRIQRSIYQNAVDLLCRFPNVKDIYTTILNVCVCLFAV